jgi:hypothetical protein
MKTNTLKLFLATLFVHLMCFTVVLSHMHAKDAISLLSQQANLNRLVTSDITAKAMGDLHHHIDKASLKNIHTDNSTTAARVRELEPLEAEPDNDSLLGRMYDFLLRLRVVASLCYQAI